jgi:hypothetical protein
MVDVWLPVDARHVAERDDEEKEEREDERTDPNGPIRWH